MSHNGYQQPQPDTNEAPATNKISAWWIIISVVLITYFAAFISSTLGNDPLMFVFAVICMLTITTAAVFYLVRKAIRDAPQSKAVQEGSSIRAYVAWKTLWLVPSLLLFIGFVRSIAGTTPDGIAIGVIGVLTLLPIIPTYIVLGIMRATRKKR
jgi:hypothetical protein